MVHFSWLSLAFTHLFNIFLRRYNKYTWSQKYFYRNVIELRYQPALSYDLFQIACSRVWISLFFFLRRGAAGNHFHVFLVLGSRSFSKPATSRRKKLCSSSCFLPPRNSALLVYPRSAVQLFVFSIPQPRVVRCLLVRGGDLDGITYSRALPRSSFQSDRPFFG